MSVLDPFYRKQQAVVDHLAEAVEQIPEDKLMWKPCKRSLPWLYLFYHTGTHRQMLLRLFKDEPHNFPVCYAEAAKEAKTPSDVAEFLRETWNEFRSFLESKPADYADKAISPPWGGPDMTVEQLAWWTFEESVHHRGQAWLYARMNGITPPVIWGTEDIGHF